MDITELTGIAETSSCIITDIHFQRGKFSCRFGGVFLALFVCLWSIGRLQYDRLGSAAFCIQSCLLHVSPSIMAIFRTGLFQYQNQNSSSRTVTAGARVRSQTSKIEICGAEGVSGTGFIRALLLPPMLHTHSVTL